MPRSERVFVSYVPDVPRIQRLCIRTHAHTHPHTCKKFEKCGTSGTFRSFMRADLGKRCTESGKIGGTKVVRPTSSSPAHPLGELRFPRSEAVSACRGPCTTFSGTRYTSCR